MLCEGRDLYLIKPITKQKKTNCSEEKPDSTKAFPEEFSLQFFIK